ncbi:MAG: DEAD/DEAH box helicase [Thermoleophilia bacterium]
MTANAIQLKELLEKQYRSFYDSYYGFSDPSLRRERARILEEAGLGTDVILEPLVPYISSGMTFAQVATELGLGDDVAEFVGCLFGELRLYWHQREALVQYEAGRNVVTTAGTGSGKTESFLMPVLSSLIQESRSWSGHGATPAPWWHGGKKLAYLRAGETGRPAAVRSLILYPMNALVEDQMVRLRRVLDSEGQLAWLDDNRLGHRFFFGRYTGQTPKRNLDALMREFEHRSRRAAEMDALLAGKSEGKDSAGYRAYVARPLGAEMLTRQDMWAYQPDVLITNYSMLNIMLGRPEEDHIFDSTKEWLESGSGSFHLVVDELHSYKGTAGTEVALLLRRFLHRIGLRGDSPNLRILSASASLGENEELAGRYLEEFFGADRSSFAILDGRTVVPDPGGSPVVSQDMAGVLGRIGRAVLAEDGAALDLAMVAASGLADAKLSDKLVTACLDETQKLRPTPALVVADRLFPGKGEDERLAMLAGLIACQRQVESSLCSPASPGIDRLRMRAHYFFRTLPGWWACSNPHCNSVLPEYRTGSRSVGKLYGEPRLRCECGSRCLDVLVCQSCGDILLGGYATEDKDGRQWLFPEFPDLEKAPDEAFPNLAFGSYRVVWPKDPSEWVPQDKDWTSGGVGLGWRRGCLNHAVGSLESDAPDINVWRFVPLSGGRESPETDAISSIPTRCPNCGDDWERKMVRGAAGTRGLEPTDPARMRSPIRRPRAHHARVAQILSEHALAAVHSDPCERRMVAFSDSRQDAARLNAELDIAHHRDTIRQLVVESLQQTQARARAVRDAELFLEDPDSYRHLEPAFRQMVEVSDAIRALRAARDPLATPSEKKRATELVDQEKAARLLLPAARDSVFKRLLSVGRNPAGLHDSADGEWYSLFDWSDKDVEALNPGDLEIDAIRNRCMEEVAAALFAGTGRDVESLGLAVVAPVEVAPAPSFLDADLGRSVLLGSIRVLGCNRLYKGGREGRDEYGNPPKPLSEWLTAVESLHDFPAGSLVEWARGALPLAGQPCQGWLVRPNRCVLEAHSTENWGCPRCGWRHAHQNAGVCMHCRTALLAEPDASSKIADDDYYVALAKRGTPVWRFSTAELTGQTERSDAANRQARFQNIFLEREPERPSGIDVLSVTTTMEAGVDIGALLVVLMGNVPPRRFNYQQRVGRAGRRDDPLSVAITVARERSHDMYYFRHPQSMTADPPPPPYLATDRDEIIQRVVNAEILLRGFRSIDSDDFIGGVNVHGHFGLADDWSAWKTLVLRGIDEGRDSLLTFCEDLLAKTRTSVSPETLLRRCLASLPADIDRIAALSGEAPELSQRLAEHGLFPMFGFPTQERKLYTSRPKGSRPWPPSGAVGRDLWLAISEFAPGNEIVVDKRVHRAVGCVSYVPRASGFPEAVREPLGPIQLAGLCDVCKSIDIEPAAACRNCGAKGSSEYRKVPLAFPLGFRTSWRRAEPYEAGVERHSRASVPRVTVEERELAPARVANLIVRSGTTRLYAVNDNNSNLFGFQETDSSSGVVDSEQGMSKYTNKLVPPRRVALAAAMRTDVLLANFATPRGGGYSHVFHGTRKGMAQLVSTARRAAWTSFAFALRSAAAFTLDIEVSEIAAGLKFIRDKDSGELFPQIFLTDTIENGAGYVSYLGRTDNFRALLDATTSLTGDWAAPSHKCDSSCYSCLKDYTNSPYHSLLDWRLAADTLDLVLYGQLQGDRWAAIRETAVKTSCDGLPGWSCDDPGAAEPTIVSKYGSSEITIIHPLRDRDEALLSRTWRSVDADVFNLHRRPGAVYLATVRGESRA